MAKIVKMYEAQDGTLHKTAALCAEHEVKARLAPAMEKFVDAIKPDTKGLYVATNEPLTDGIFLDLTALPGFLVDNAEELRKLLNASLVTPKPRKSKNGAAGEAKPGRRKKDQTPAAPAATAAEPETAAAPEPAATAGDSVDELLESLKD